MDGSIPKDACRCQWTEDQQPWCGSKATAEDLLCDLCREAPGCIVMRKYLAEEEAQKMAAVIETGETTE